MKGKGFIKLAEEINLSDEELARILGIHLKSVQRWVRGDRDCGVVVERYLKVLASLKNGNFDIKEYMKRYNCDPWAE